MLVTRKAFVAVGGFDVEMSAMQDWDLWLRLARQYGIQTIKKKIILYRDHDQPRISTNRLRRIKGLKRLLSKNMQYWPKRAGISPRTDCL